jgi:hypothetical protein
MKISSLIAASCFGLALISLTACGGGKSSNSSNTSANSAATNAPMSAASGAMGSMANGAMGAANGTVPNCGAVTAVWVNLNSKAYHEAGDPYYGKTKHGEYLCPSQAKAQGFHPAGGSTMTTHHRKSTSAAPEANPT